MTLPPRDPPVWEGEIAGPGVKRTTPVDRTFSPARKAFRAWWKVDPILAVDEALHCLPRLHRVLFAWWLCDIVDWRLGMPWRDIVAYRRGRR